MGLVSKYVLPAGLIIGVLIGGSQLIQYIERRGLDRFEQRLTQVASVCEYNSRDTFRSDFFTEHNLEDSDDGK